MRWKISQFNKAMRHGLVMVVLLFSGFAVAAPTLAASGQGLNLTTSPLPINLVAEPGSTVTADLRVRNDGVKTQKIKVGLLKFDAYGQEGKPRLMERGAGDDYFDWVSFSQTTFDAVPGVWQNIKMTITVPKSAAFGYYYAVTFSLADLGAPTAGQRQAAIAGSAATLVLLEALSPNAKRQIDVAEFSTDHSLYEFLPASFKVNLRNSGNVHVIPRGTIFISKDGQDVGTVDINADRGNVLPASNRLFTGQWLDGFPSYHLKEANGKVVLDKNGKEVQELKWDFGQLSKLRFGKYTAHLLMAYDDGKRDVPVESELTFWVIPWRVLGVGLLVVVVLGAGLWMIGRGLWRSLRRK